MPAIRRKYASRGMRSFSFTFLSLSLFFFECCMSFLFLRASDKEIYAQAEEIEREKRHINVR